MRNILIFLVLCLVLVSSANAAANGLPSQGTIPDGLGVNIHTTHDVHAFNMVEDAGAKFIRMDMTWEQIETVKGQYNFAPWDNLTQQCSARGIRPIYILSYANPFYSSGSSNTEEFRQGFANFAATAAARYKDNGVIWELWNEPANSGGDATWTDGPNPTQYMAMVNVAAPRIRQADPNATIIAPAVGPWEAGFLSTCCELGLLNQVDAVSVHPYGDPPDAQTQFDRYNNVKWIMNHFGGATKPIVASECGWNINTVTPEQQGDYLARYFLVNASLGIPLSIWYDFGDSTNPSEDGWGLVTAYYEPKPAYQELERLTQSLRGTTFDQRLESNSEDWLLVFKTPDGHETLAAWTTGDAHTINHPEWGVLSLSGTPFYVNPVPEPGTISLLGIAGLSVLGYLWKK